MMSCVAWLPCSRIISDGYLFRRNTPRGIAALFCFVMVLMSIGGSTSYGEEPKQLYLIQVKDLFGFIDAKGEVVIKPQFAQAREFSEGLAAVILAPEKQPLKWGFCNTDGRIVINPQYEDVADFSQGLAAVLVNDKYGFIDTSGRTVIEPQFGTKSVFHEDIAWVRAPGNQAPDDMSIGTVELFAGRRDFYFPIDKKGSRLCSDTFTDPSLYYDGLCQVRVDKWRESDPDTDRGDEKARLEHVRKKLESDLRGFIGRDSKYVIPPQFHAARDFHEGLAAVLVDVDEEAKWGYIDNSGRLVIPARYGNAKSFSEHVACVTTIVGTGASARLKYGFIGRSGQYVIQPKFDGAESFQGDLAAVKENESWGYCDVSGRIVIKPKFTRAYSFRGALAMVHIDESTAYIDRTGKIVWGPEDVYLKQQQTPWDRERD